MAFHRHDLDRLVVERVEPVHIACENLHRHDQRRHPHRHREHLARMRIRPVFQQVPCADAANHERRGEIGGQHGVDEAVGEAGVEDDIPPAFARQELPVGADLVADRRLHPAIDRENPESGNESAEGDHAGGGEMQALADLVHPEQHHAEEARFEEEGGQHLICHQWPDHRARLVREYCPVGAELVAHHDAGDDAHGEGDGEDLEPVFEQVEIELLARPEPQPFEHHQIARQPDRESRENEVEAHREGELDPGEQQRVKAVEHGPFPYALRRIISSRESALFVAYCATSFLRRVNPYPVDQHRRLA